MSCKCFIHFLCPKICCEAHPTELLNSRLHQSRSTDAQRFFMVLHISSFLEKSSIQAKHWLLLTCSVSLVIHVLNLLGGSRPTSWSSFNRPFRLAEAHIANTYSNWYGGVWNFTTFWKHIELVDIIRHLNFDFEIHPYSHPCFERPCVSCKTSIGVRYVGSMTTCITSFLGGRTKAGRFRSHGRFRTYHVRRRNLLKGWEQ